MTPSMLSNPFALLMDPQSVVAAIESSDPLGQLNRRVFRPLDKPWIASTVSADAAAFDAMVDDDEDDFELEV